MKRRRGRGGICIFDCGVNCPFSTGSPPESITVLRGSCSVVTDVVVVGFFLDQIDHVWSCWDVLRSERFDTRAHSAAGYHGSSTFLTENNNLVNICNIHFPFFPSVLFIPLTTKINFLKILINYFKTFQSRVPFDICTCYLFRVRAILQLGTRGLHSRFMVCFRNDVTFQLTNTMFMTCWVGLFAQKLMREVCAPKFPQFDVTIMAASVINLF